MRKIPGGGVRVVFAIAAILAPAIAIAATITLKDTGINCNRAITAQHKIICENESYLGIFRAGGGRWVIAVPHNIRDAKTEEEADANHLSFYLQDRSSRKTEALKICMDESIDMPFSNQTTSAGKYMVCAESLDFMVSEQVHFDEKTKYLRIAGMGNCHGYGVAYYKLNQKSKSFDLTAYITQPDCDASGYTADSPDIIIYERSLGAKFPKLP